MAQFKKIKRFFSNQKEKQRKPETQKEEKLFPKLEHSDHYGQENTIRLFPAPAIIEAYRSEIDETYKMFRNTDQFPDFRRTFDELIFNFASFVSQLPASRNHHHSKPGGLFIHSLDVGKRAILASFGHIMNQDSLPRNRDADQFAWILSCFLSGLLHDIGKIHTLGFVRAIGVISTHSGFQGSTAPKRDYIWHPNAESLDSWIDRFNVDRAVIEYHEKTPNHEPYVTMFFHQIVPKSIVGFIENANPRISSMLALYVMNPSLASSAPLFTILRDADHQSVRYDLDPKGYPGSETISSLVYRRFYEFACDTVWNLPKSPFLHAYLEIPQKSPADPTRYVAANFFIATNENIELFLKYIQSQEMFGVSFNLDNREETVFKFLKTMNAVSPTIPHILNKQIPSPDLPSYIPASVANITFAVPELTEDQKKNLSHPIPEQPITLSLPVVPMCSAPPRVDFERNMPAISFTGDPVIPFVKVPHIRIDDGELKPSDPALDTDPEQLATIKQLFDENAIEVDRNSGDPVTTTVLSTLDRVTDLLGMRDGVVSSEGTSEEPNADSTPQKELPLPLPDGNGNRSQEAPKNKKVSEPKNPSPVETPKPNEALWLQVYKSPDDENTAFNLIAAIWFFFEGSGNASMEGDHYEMTASCFSSSSRNEIMEQLRTFKSPDMIKYLSVNWSATGLNERVKARTLKRTEQGTLRVRPPVAAIISQFKTSSTTPATDQQS